MEGKVMGETWVGQLWGDGKGTEEGKERDPHPSHVRSLPTFQPIMQTVHYRINLFCSLAVLDPRVGHTMDVLSSFIPVLCHSD